jgi:predicted nucleic acid-binding protein
MELSTEVVSSSLLHELNKIKSDSIKVKFFTLNKFFIIRFIFLSNIKIILKKTFMFSNKMINKRKVCDFFFPV